jgi:hypothetical protein
VRFPPSAFAPSFCEEFRGGGSAATLVTDAATDLIAGATVALVTTAVTMTLVHNVVATFIKVALVLNPLAAHEGHELPTQRPIPDAAAAVAGPR